MATSYYGVARDLRAGLRQLKVYQFVFGPSQKGPSRYSIAL